MNKANQEALEQKKREDEERTRRIQNGVGGVRMPIITAAAAVPVHHLRIRIPHHQVHPVPAAAGMAAAIKY